MHRSALLAAVLVSAVAWAKPIPEDSPDHANHYASTPLQAGGVTVSADYAWARQAQLKLKVAIDNGTTGYFLLAKDGLQVTTGGAQFQPEPKPGKFEIVAPHDKGGHLFVIDDDSNRLHHDAMQAVLGGAWTADPGVAPLPAEPTQIPPASASFQVGPFQCAVKGSVKRKTDVLDAKYTCTYNGETGHVGFVRGNAAQVTIASGKAFANEAKGDLELVLPGDTVTIEIVNTTIQPRTEHVDLQFDTVGVRWDGVFREATLQPVTFGPWSFTLDEALTAAKND